MDRSDRSCAAIHDLAGLGKCALTIVLPVLSACGVETSVLPTAALSTHTGFSDFTYRDLTEDLLPMARHWKAEGARFSSLYSGFLGSAAQIGIVEEIFSLFREEDTLVLVDPVMGDNGRLYRTYTPEMADGMARLCRQADLVVPNLTEACHILGMPYADGLQTRGQVEEILGKLCKLGPKMAVLTGVSTEEGSLGAACFDAAAGKVSFLMGSREEGSFHGTGDIFASVLLGGLLNGMALEKACGTAVEFTLRAIRATKEDGRETRFGPRFECVLPWLAVEMERARNGGKEGDGAV